MRLLGYRGMALQADSWLKGVFVEVLSWIFERCPGLARVLGKVVTSAWHGFREA